MLNSVSASFNLADMFTECCPIFPIDIIKATYIDGYCIEAFEEFLCYVFIGMLFRVADQVLGSLQI